MNDTSFMSTRKLVLSVLSSRVANTNQTIDEVADAMRSAHPYAHDTIDWASTYMRDGGGCLECGGRLYKGRVYHFVDCPVKPPVPATKTPEGWKVYVIDTLRVEQDFEREWPRFLERMPRWARWLYKLDIMKPVCQGFFELGYREGADYVTFHSGQDA